MKKGRPPVSPEIAELLSLVANGRLFAVQDWIKAGRPVRAPNNELRELCPLWRAAQSGFHSMAEVLLQATQWDRAALEGALCTAMSNGRIDVVDLLLANGAPIDAIDFEEVCRTVKPDLMIRFLRAGVDPTKDNAFARALDDIKARPLLRFYKEMRGEFPKLDDQAALALKEAVKERKLRWAALLRWAGADPFRRVPDDLYSQLDPHEEESGTTAAREACYGGNPEIFKVLKLKPTAEQARELLFTASLADSPEFLKTCLQVIPAAELNNGEDGDCEALRYLISRSQYSFYLGGISHEQRDLGIASCIEALLNAGAQWRPSPSEIRSARRGLLEHDGKHIVRVVRLLLYTPGCCSLEDLRELCRTPTIRQKVIQADPPLWSELQEASNGVGA